MSKPYFEAPEKPVKNTGWLGKRKEQDSWYIDDNRIDKEEVFISAFVEPEETVKEPKKPWWKR